MKDEKGEEKETEEEVDWKKRAEELEESLELIRLGYIYNAVIVKCFNQF